ncbi:MAG: hypothetical protein QOG20_398 [Pseudonocardiales bacterium]|nr:hypothetical protein [Pseudonocardiales bacterium]
MRGGCGDRLESTLASVAAAGRGVVLYLRIPAHRTDWRGTGRLLGLRAGTRQDDATHHDVVEAGCDELVLRLRDPDAGQVDLRSAEMVSAGYVGWLSRWNPRRK